MDYAEIKAYNRYVLRSYIMYNQQLSYNTYIIESSTTIPYTGRENRQLEYGLSR